MCCNILIHGSDERGLLEFYNDPVIVESMVAAAWKGRRSRRKNEICPADKRPLSVNWHLCKNKKIAVLGDNTEEARCFLRLLD